MQQVGNLRYDFVHGPGISPRLALDVILCLSLGGTGTQSGHQTLSQWKQSYWSTERSEWAAYKFAGFGGSG